MILLPQPGANRTSTHRRSTKPNVPAKYRAAVAKLNDADGDGKTEHAEDHESGHGRKASLQSTPAKSPHPKRTKASEPEESKAAFPGSQDGSTTASSSTSDQS